MAETGIIGRAFGGGIEDDGIGAPLYSGYNGPVEMLPNPDFVFPLPAPSTETAPPVPPMSSRRTPPPSFGARRGSAQSARKSINALPDFSFNPSGSEPVAVPTIGSPQPTTPTIPSHGHRRGGSEFIGGDSKASVVGLMSTSPTKGDGILPPPAPGLRPGLPAGRRGHAHRRSGAISCHDLSNIMQSRSPNPSHGSSAPATPAESDMSAWPSHQVNRSISQPSLQRIGASDDAPNLPSPDSSPQRPPSRARVGFSDKVEYIRPLSTISSETESSMSTIRGHSVSNSLSSVASIGAPSPPSARRTRPPPLSAVDGRPSTASAVFDSRPDDLSSNARPASLVSPTSSMSSFSSPLSTPSKKRHFFQLTSRQSGTMDNTIRASTSEPLLAATADSPPGSPTRQTAADESDEDTDRHAGQRRSTRAPRKVKSWVSSLMSREPKAHDARQRRPPTPPVPALPTDTEAELMANFDEDNTVTIVTPTSEQVPPPKVQTDIAAWKPRHMSPESDARSPVIDLDLAMSPYEMDRKSQPGSRASFTARRTMHSGAFQSSLQNHRRTESAPALVPFEGRSAAGGANVMAEVFEEEEEDELHAATRNADPQSKEDSVQTEQDSIRADSIDSTNLSVGIQVVDSDAPSGKPVSWNFDDGLGIHNPSQESTPRATRISSPTAPSPALQAENSLQCSPVEVVEDYEEPRASSLTRSSDSTITPSLDSEVKETQPAMALPLPLPDQSFRTPDTFTDASFSTSNLSYRQNSLDTPRLGTSASSIADNRTLNSQLTSEPVPSLRISTDDVPSLTSSRSTATNGMPQPRSIVSPRTPAERTESVPSFHTTNSERRNKRASIVSLSRLMGVGGTFGEREHGRSKLNIEQRPQSEHMDLREFSQRKEVKAKKTRRFSKMIQFWKSSKDTSRS